MDALNIEVGTKGFSSFGGINARKFKHPATVIAIYTGYTGEKMFAILSDFGHCQSVASDFDEFGLCQYEGEISRRFEVTE